MKDLPRPQRYDVSSPVLPGLSKVIEELGEALQVAGKYLATDGQSDHWDGDLDSKMTDEVGDALAALTWFVRHNHDRISQQRVMERKYQKLAIYERWREERLMDLCPACLGSACEEGCGLSHPWYCDHSPSAYGPDAHRQCRTCGGRGRVSKDA